MSNLITSRRILRPQFDARPIVGLAGWWDCSSDIISDSSGVVSRIVDRSIYGRDMTTMFGTPLVSTNFQNGLRMFRVTASPAQSATSQTASAEDIFGPNRNSVTWFLAWRLETGNICARIIDASGTSNRLDHRSAGSLTVACNGTNYVANSHPSSADFRVMCNRFDGDSGRHDAWTNLSKSVTQTNFTGLQWGTGSTYKVMFGNNAVAATADFGESLVFNRSLSDEEVWRVQSYLVSKWITI